LSPRFSNTHSPLPHLYPRRPQKLRRISEFRPRNPPKRGSPMCPSFGIRLKIGPLNGFRLRELSLSPRYGVPGRDSATHPSSACRFLILRSTPSISGREFARLLG
jgi:hypothetical protein